MEIKNTYIGVDVSKATLQVDIGDSQITLENNAKGHKELCRQLGVLEAPQVICEATGGYEQPMVLHLQRRGLSVSVVNPARVRYAAKAFGKEAKTDEIDASMLREYGEMYRPWPDQILSENQHRITALAVWLRQLTEAKGQHKMQMHHHCNPFVRRHSRRFLKAYESGIKEVQTEIGKLIKKDGQFLAKVNALTQIKGVGTRTAVLVLAFMPEIGSLGRKQAASMAGLAPWNFDSGKIKGQRHIRGGRADVRKALYMASLTASRCNPGFKAFYERLRANGKHHKKALIAVMRKLIVAMNSRIKNLHT